MSSKIYVCHLPFQTTKNDLEKLFSAFGTISAVTLAKESGSERPKEFAFVEFKEKDAAQKAIDTINGKEYNGRQLHVEHYHQDRCSGRWS